MFFSSILAVLLAFGLLSGCAPKVGVRPVKLDKRFEDMNRNALNSDSLSEQTSMFLRKRNLVEAWKKSPGLVLEQVDRLLQENPDTATMFSMMELCFLRARESAPLSMEAFQFYLSSAYYAYTYLFDPEIDLMPSPYDPHSRLACDFYNRSLAGCLVIYRDQRMRFGKDLHLSMLRGRVAVTPGRQETGWDLREIEDFHVAYEFEPLGLENHVKAYGIGVPVIAIRAPHASGQQSKAEQFLPKLRQTLPATVLLRFEGGISEPGAQLFQARLDLYDPMDSDMVEIGDRQAPLETDFTTPLAYAVEKSSMPKGITGLLRGESWEAATNWRGKWWVGLRARLSGHPFQEKLH